MSNSSLIRRADLIVKMFILVFVGVALQATIVFPQIYQILNQNSPPFFPPWFYPSYLGLVLGYSLLTSVYVTPRMVISPFYTKLGTLAVSLLLIFFNYGQFGISEKAGTFAGLMIIVFFQLATFALLGYGESLLLRKMIGMYGELGDIHTRTYKIGISYSLVKKMLQKEFAKDFHFDEPDENKYIMTRKGNVEVKVLILLTIDTENPNESTMSISTSEIKFDSFWKTEQARKRLNAIEDRISGELYRYHAIRLLPDKEDSLNELLLNESRLKLLESAESSLTRISKNQRNRLFVIGGLFSLGAIITALVVYPNSPLQVKSEIIPEVVVTTWVSILVAIGTTVVFKNVENIEEKFAKNMPD